MHVGPPKITKHILADRLTNFQPLFKVSGYKLTYLVVYIILLLITLNVNISFIIDHCWVTDHRLRNSGLNGMLLYLSFDKIEKKLSLDWVFLLVDNVDWFNGLPLWCRFNIMNAFQKHRKIRYCATKYYSYILTGHSNHTWHFFGQFYTPSPLCVIFVVKIECLWPEKIKYYSQKNQA